MKQTVDKQFEIVSIKATCPRMQGQAQELYFIFSRRQLELVLQSVEISSEPEHQVMARYEEELIPLINLEEYYGLQNTAREESKKYLVLRVVGEGGKLKKILVQISSQIQIEKLRDEYTAVHFNPLAKNNEQVLGLYSLRGGKLGIVPDLSAIYRSLDMS